MTANAPRPPAVFPSELQTCLDQEGCKVDELARRLLAGHSSLLRYRHSNEAALSDLDWFIGVIRTLLRIQFADEPWPIAIPDRQFIPAAAKCLSHVYLAEWRLATAEALDIQRGYGSASDPP